jgi:lysophospholipase L1-like esterase
MRGETDMSRTQSLKIAVVLAFFAAALASMIFFSVRKTAIDAKIAALSDPVLTPCAPPADSDNRRPRLYLIGDSSLTRWPTKNFAEDWETINCSLGQEPATGLSRRVANFEFLRPQDAVLISSGLYDLVAASLLDSARASEAVEQTTRVLLDVAQSANDKDRRVLLATLIPPSAPDATRRVKWREPLRDLIAQANVRLRQSTPSGRIEIVDFAAALNSDDRTTPNNYRVDSLHVNAIGNKRLADAVEQALSAP